VIVEPIRALVALAAIVAIGSSACVREKNVRIESGRPGPWREQRLLQPREPLAHVSVTLRQARGGVEIMVERHASCYAIDVREVPRERVSEQVTVVGTYFVAAALAVTGAVVVVTAESGKEGVVPAGLGVLGGGGAVLAAGALSEGRSRSVLPSDTEHRVRSPVSCNRQAARHARIVLRSGDLVQQAETDDAGHASFADWPSERREETQVFIEGLLVTDVRHIE
jgi:hypothetical protein